MNPRAALALLAVLTAIGIGTAVWNRTPAGDFMHVVASAPPCDGGLCLLPPDRCEFVTTRFGPNASVVPDGGSGLSLTKVCFVQCDFDGGFYEVEATGSNPIPCKEPKYDGGPARCADGSIPFTDYRDLCKDHKGAELPPGVEALVATWTRPYVKGEPQVEVWAAEHVEAPWRCACGGPGHDPDAGPCKFRTDDFLDGGIARTVELPAAGPLQAQTIVYTERIPNGKKWTKPGEAFTVSRDPSDWKGNCHPMPCGTWSGVDPMPPECRADEFKGLECGMGKIGRRLSGDQRADDAGRPMTCVGNRWVRSCDPTWECGEGKWFKEQCSAGCERSKNNPDAGLCYSEPKCADHRCVQIPAKCAKITVTTAATAAAKPAGKDAGK